MTGGGAERFWGPWSALDLKEPLSPRVLEEILDGGQAFRWNRQSHGIWAGVWGNHFAEVRLDDRHRIHWRAPSGREGKTGAALRDYFDASRPSRATADALPWRSDGHLARCIEAFPGLRILRQPFEETLLCFLCSAAKQIPQIKQMAEALARHHGRALAEGPVSEMKFRRLPTWEELAALPEKALRECRLGFRARHIHRTALYLAERPGWLRRVAESPYAEAKAMLCDLPGVGEKIADCALLFGAARLEAFPVDTWILRAMARRYGLDGWRPAQVAQFGRVHFGPLAGLAQQYLFAWERGHVPTSDTVPSQHQPGVSDVGT